MWELDLWKEGIRCCKLNFVSKMPCTRGGPLKTKCCTLFSKQAMPNCVPGHVTKESDLFPLTCTVALPLVKYRGKQTRLL